MSYRKRQELIKKQHRDTLDLQIKNSNTIADSIRDVEFGIIPSIQDNRTQNEITQDKFLNQDTALQNANKLFKNNIAMSRQLLNKLDESRYLQFNRYFIDIYTSLQGQLKYLTVDDAYDYINNYLDKEDYNAGVRDIIPSESLLNSLIDKIEEQTNLSVHQRIDLTNKLDALNITLLKNKNVNKIMYDKLTLLTAERAQKLINEDDNDVFTENLISETSSISQDSLADVKNNEIIAKDEAINEAIDEDNYTTNVNKYQADSKDYEANARDDRNDATDKRSISKESEANAQDDRNDATDKRSIFKKSKKYKNALARINNSVVYTRDTDLSNMDNFKTDVDTLTYFINRTEPITPGDQKDFVGPLLKRIFTMLGQPFPEDTLENHAKKFEELRTGPLVDALGIFDLKDEVTEAKEDIPDAKRATTKTEDDDIEYLMSADVTDIMIRIEDNEFYNNNRGNKTNVEQFKQDVRRLQQTALRPGTQNKKQSQDTKKQLNRVLSSLGKRHVANMGADTLADRFKGLELDRLITALQDTGLNDNYISPQKSKTGNMSTIRDAQPSNIDKSTSNNSGQPIMHKGGTLKSKFRKMR